MFDPMTTCTPLHTLTSTHIGKMCTSQFIQKKPWTTLPNRSGLLFVSRAKNHYSYALHHRTRGA